MDRNQLQNSAPPLELFRYKVVYPGGTYIRVSPAVDSERTGEIIEYNVIFAASKSLVLDGVNYVKLADNRGWVLSSKGETEVLELVEVVRMPGTGQIPSGVDGADSCASSTSSSTSSTTVGSSESSVAAEVAAAASTTVALAADSFVMPQVTVLRAAKEKEKLFQNVRADNRFWRDVGSKCMLCDSFEAYASLSLEVTTESSVESGGAKGGRGRPQDPQIRSLIRLIVSVTGQWTGPEVADLTGLEAALWVLVHLGPRSSHVVGLAMAAANERYEWLPEERQTELLHAVLEVGARTRQHTLDLCKIVDVLPEDVKSFVQRWLVVRSYEIEYVFVQDEAGQGEGGEDERNMVAPTPSTARGVLKQTVSWMGLDLPAWLCGVPAPHSKGRWRRVRRSAGTQRNSSQRRPHHSRYSGYGTSELDQRTGADDRMNGSARNDDDDDDDDDEAEGDVGEEGGEEGSFWDGLGRSVKQIIADPDLQLAGLI